MPDWRGKDDDDMYEHSDRKQRGRRGQGRGAKGFDAQDDFGSPEDFMPPVFADEYTRTPGYNSPASRRGEPRDANRGGYGGDRSGGDRFGGGDRHGGGERHGGGDRSYGGGRSGGENRFGGPDRSADTRPRPPQGDRPPREERGPRQPGTVKFFKADKGFGFITPDNGDADVFVHISAVERSGLTTLDSGQRISFETEPDRRGKGPKAVSLQVEEE